MKIKHDLGFDDFTHFARMALFRETLPVLRIVNVVHIHIHTLDLYNFLYDHSLACTQHTHTHTHMHTTTHGRTRTHTHTKSLLHVKLQDQSHHIFPSSIMLLTSSFLQMCLKGGHTHTYPSTHTLAHTHTPIRTLTGREREPWAFNYLSVSR